MNMELSRRAFMRRAGAGAVATSLSALGFAEVETAYAQTIRAVQAREHHGNAQRLHLLLRRLRHSHVLPGQPCEGRKKPEKSSISKAVPDHPRTAARFPEGRGAAGFREVRDAHEISDGAQTRLRQVRRVTWDYALDRIAQLMKTDRDANFIARNGDGVTVEPLDEHRLPRRVRNDERNGLRDL